MNCSYFSQSFVNHVSPSSGAGSPGTHPILRGRVSRYAQLSGNIPLGHSFRFGKEKPTGTAVEMEQEKPVCPPLLQSQGDVLLPPTCLSSWACQTARGKHCNSTTPKPGKIRDSQTLGCPARFTKGAPIDTYFINHEAQSLNTAHETFAHTGPEHQSNELQLFRLTTGRPTG